MQKRLRTRARRGIEKVAWCFVLRGAAFTARERRFRRQSLGGRAAQRLGGVAQLGERLLCKQEVIGSIPFTSTIAQCASRIVARAVAVAQQPRERLMQNGASAGA